MLPLQGWNQINVAGTMGGVWFFVVTLWSWGALEATTGSLPWGGDIRGFQGCCAGSVLTGNGVGATVTEEEAGVGRGFWRCQFKAGIPTVRATSMRMLPTFQNYGQELNQPKNKLHHNPSLAPGNGMEAQICSQLWGY